MTELSERARRAPTTTAAPEAIFDLEFEVTADDPHAIGRAMYHGKRTPTLIYAVILLGMAAIFVWLGNWVAAVVLVVLAAVIYANPKIGFLDRWLARRMPGNRIGTTWRFQMGPFGIDYWGSGVNGHIDWDALRDIHFGAEAIAVMGADNSLLAGIPLRVLTPWQLSTMRDMIQRFATNARIIE